MSTFNDGYKFSMEECPQLQYHGEPFRYCGYCGWVEMESDANTTAQITAIPSYVMDLVRAVKTGKPLDFQGHQVPKAIQLELEKDWGPAPHQCLINTERDNLAYREQYLIGCQCHEGNTKHVWQFMDPPYVCPVSGTIISDPRTLIPAEDPDGGE